MGVREDLRKSADALKECANKLFGDGYSEGGIVPNKSDDQMAKPERKGEYIIPNDAKTLAAMLGIDATKLMDDFVKLMEPHLKKVIPVKLKLGDGAGMPKYGRQGDACFDLSATCDERGDLSDHRSCMLEIEPGKTAVFDTQNFFEIPKDHVMLVFGRSGHGLNHDISLSNCTGIIDSNYRGSVKVKLRNDGDCAYEVEAGERIAQAMVIPVSEVQFTLTDDLSETNRGVDGFGSSGKV